MRKRFFSFLRMILRNKFISRAPKGKAPSPARPPLDPHERSKRKREFWLIGFLAILFLVLTVAEFKLTRVSSTLPFVNSIFFFGLLNINLILLITLLWLIFRNIGKIFLERRSRVLGARLKTKLVLAFLAFSIIPTLTLFTISSLYINSSFDKWFSLKIQNTLQASLEITATYYKNAYHRTNHFAEHLAKQLGTKLRPSTIDGPPPSWIQEYLAEQQELLALHAAEFYSDPLEERVLAHSNSENVSIFSYPRLSLDVLDRAFAGEKVQFKQHLGDGDLIRGLAPVKVGTGKNEKVIGVIAVTSYVPVSLVNKVDEIASVSDDYKETNPLKYPIKTTYFSILVMITLVIIFVAIWMGLFLARQLTVPVERLVRGATQVGAGNLDVKIEGVGHDEISVLVSSFNKMIYYLKENRTRLTQTTQDLERRTLQLEAVLANVGTGVIVVDNLRRITTFNRAASHLLDISPENALKKNYQDVLKDDTEPLAELINRSFDASSQLPDPTTEVSQWNFRTGDSVKSLTGIATSLQDNHVHWGVVVVIEDMTHLIKGQRELAWREVARRIAHEIKNPLTPIKLSAQRLQRRFGHYRGKEGDVFRECTDTIIKHSDELKEMVNEFSNFARFPEISPAPNQLNQAIQEVVTLFSQAHPHIQFKTKAEERLPVFEFDRDQIKRVIMNLLDNSVSALKASPGVRKGRINIETHYNDQLQMAVVTISDNGPGMPDQVKARVFEPYFSTKKEGTGLGLAIAKRIVNDHDGFIRVQSKEGKGTQFFIELPTSIRQDFDPRAVNQTSEKGVNLK